jgi:lauroyl/myristoyl acyltransferase
LLTNIIFITSSWEETIAFMKATLQDRVKTYIASYMWFHSVLELRRMYGRSYAM